MHFPTAIPEYLISWNNPNGKITNSDLEIAGSMLYRACMEDCYYIRERTTLAWKENMAGLWCNQKSLATSTSPPDHLLMMQASHQRFHCYVPCHEFVSGVDNVISYFQSRSVYLTGTNILAYMDRT